jgi:hypothetical protein
VLHIGMTKTGSTALQRVLAKRRPELAAMGVCFPVSPGRAGNHVMLPAAACEPAKHARFSPNDWDGLPPDAAVARFRRDFAREMATLPKATRLLLLSAEQCSALLTTEEEVARLRDLLAPHSSRIRVLVYLRRQDAHYASAWVEGLRAGNTTPMALPQAGPEALPRYDYAAMLDRWAAIFGERAVEPRIYEHASLAAATWWPMCCRRPASPSTCRPTIPTARANASLDPSAIALLQRMQPRSRALPGPSASASSRRWAAPCPAAAGARTDDAAAFLARFRGANEAVRRRWFPSRPALFAEAPAPPPRPPPPTPRTPRSTCSPRCWSRAARARGRCSPASPRCSCARGVRRRRRILARRPPRRAGPAEAHAGLAEQALAAGDRATAAAHLARLRSAHPSHAATLRLARRLGQGTA